MYFLHFCNHCLYKSHPFKLCLVENVAYEMEYISYYAQYILHRITKWIKTLLLKYVAQFISYTAEYPLISNKTISSVLSHQLCILIFPLHLDEQPCLASLFGLGVPWKCLMWLHTLMECTGLLWLLMAIKGNKTSALVDTVIQFLDII